MKFICDPQAVPIRHGVCARDCANYLADHGPLWSRVRSHGRSTQFFGRTVTAVTEGRDMSCKNPLCCVHKYAAAPRRGNRRTAGGH